MPNKSTNSSEESKPTESSKAETFPEPGISLTGRNKMIRTTTLQATERIQRRIIHCKSPTIPVFRRRLRRRRQTLKPPPVAIRLRLYLDHLPAWR